VKLAKLRNDRSPPPHLWMAVEHPRKDGRSKRNRRGLCLMLAALCRRALGGPRRLRNAPCRRPACGSRSLKVRSAMRCAPMLERVTTPSAADAVLAKREVRAARHFH
jgi:hypothetical protein